MTYDVLQTTARFWGGGIFDATNAALTYILEEKKNTRTSNTSKNSGQDLSMAQRRIIVVGR